MLLCKLRNQWETAKIYDASADFGFEVPLPIRGSIGESSNPPHQHSYLSRNGQIPAHALLADGLSLFLLARTLKVIVLE